MWVCEGGTVARTLQTSRNLHRLKAFCMLERYREKKKHRKLAESAIVLAEHRSRRDQTSRSHGTHPIRRSDQPNGGEFLRGTHRNSDGTSKAVECHVRLVKQTLDALRRPAQVSKKLVRPQQLICLSYTHARSATVAKIAKVHRNNVHCILHPREPTCLSLHVSIIQNSYRRNTKIWKHFLVPHVCGSGSKPKNWRVDWRLFPTKTPKHGSHPACLDRKAAASSGHHGHKASTATIWHPPRGTTWISRDPTHRHILTLLSPEP